MNKTILLSILLAIITLSISAQQRPEHEVKQAVKPIAVSDSLATDSLAADSLAADSLAADSLVVPPPQKVISGSNMLTLSGTMRLNTTIIPLYDKEVKLKNKYTSQFEYRRAWDSRFPDSLSGYLRGIQLSASMANHSYSHSEGYYHGEVELVSAKLGYFVGNRLVLKDNILFDYTLGINLGYSMVNKFADSYCDVNHQAEFDDFSAQLESVLVGFDIRATWIFSGFVCGVVADAYFLDNVGHTALALLVGYHW